MRKNIFKSMLLLLACACTLTFMACGDDDDTTANGGNGGTGNTSELSKLLVGNTWYVVWESEDLIEIEGMTFNADGSSVAYELKRRSSDNFSETRGGSQQANYSIQGNQLTVKVDKDTDTFTVTINSDGTLSLQDEDGDKDVYRRLESGKTLYDVMAEVAAKHQGGSNIVEGQSLVGQWNLVRIKSTRYKDDILETESEETLKAPYDRIVFFQDGRFEYWEYDNDDDHKGTEEYREDSEGLRYHEDGKGTFTENGTRFTFQSEDFDTIEVLSYDGSDNLTAKITSSENKGSYTVYRIKIFYLERVK